MTDQLNISVCEPCCLPDNPVQIRAKIFELERAITTLPGSFEGDSEHCPLKHSFADGIYMREMLIPAGTVLTGKIHRNAHHVILLEGEISIVTESGGLRRMRAPAAMISPAWTKRAGFAHTDTRWVTFHNVGDERDLQKIEELVISTDYKELEPI